MPEYDSTEVVADSSMSVCEKVCNKCKIKKPLVDFYPRKCGGYYTVCRPCSKLRRKEWSDANPERRKESNVRWAEENLDKVREKARRFYNNHQQDRLAYKRNWDRANPERRILRNARHRASKLGIEFNLELCDIVIPEICPVFGIALSRNINGNKPAENSPSLDRIDNSKGYVKGNVMVISYKANRLKGDATVDEVRRLLEYMQRAGNG